MSSKTIANQPDTRRRPRQQRALDKIELMFEATIRILESEGLAQLTTNRIAALAGVSIGTLYQYFPDKERLIAELAQRELSRTFEQLRVALARDTASGSAPPLARTLQLVHAMLGALGGRTRARQELLAALARSGHIEVFDRELHRLTVELLQHGQPQARALSGEEAFVLARAISGALRGALLQDRTMLASPAFAAALARLIGGYFAVATAAAS